MNVFDKINSYINSLKEEEPETIRSVAVGALAEIIEEYSNWYEERGFYLPPDYATNPSEWNEALHKIKRAFNLLNDHHNGFGELWDAKNKWKHYGEQDVDKIEELEKEIKEGLDIFGSQLYYLTDPKGSVLPTH